MHIPMHSDITLQRAGVSPERARPSLAIVMSVRCARRRDLPAVIACKHPCGGNTTKDVSLLFYPLFPQPCATSRRVNISAQQTRRTPGRWLSSPVGRRRRQEFSRVLHRRARMHSEVSTLGVVKISATDVPSQRRRSVLPRALAMCVTKSVVTGRLEVSTRGSLLAAPYRGAHNARTLRRIR